MLKYRPYTYILKPEHEVYPVRFRDTRMNMLS